MLPKCNSWLKFSNSNIFAETPSLFFFKDNRLVLHFPLLEAKRETTVYERI